MSGKHGDIHLDVPDDKLPAALASGAHARAVLDTKPGACLLRVVVRGPDARTFAANRAVEVPVHITAAR